MKHEAVTFSEHICICVSDASVVFVIAFVVEVVLVGLSITNEGALSNSVEF